jgi:hypothetical protein
MLSFMPLYPADPKPNKLLTVTSPIKAQKLLRWNKITAVEHMLTETS